VLQDKQVVPVGSVVPRPVDVRVVAATNCDLRQRVRSGEFREDLFYRLNVVTIEIPPLRERREDILPLIEHFLVNLAEFYEEPVKQLHDDVAKVLHGYDWPGNVRQVINVVEHVATVQDGRWIGLRDLPIEVLRGIEEGVRSGSDFPTLDQLERDHIRRALELADGEKAAAARMLGIGRPRLYRKLRKYDLEPSADSPESAR
jgi:transcriptional regulator with PAS, ATPase and Fis domain